MGQNQTNPFREGGELMTDFQIQERIPELFLTFLKHKSSNKEYLLRELTFNELRQFTLQLQKFQKRKKLNNLHLTNLEVIEERTEDQMCSSFFKIYTLWEYPKKCLTDDIALRKLQNQPFTAKELWDLIESCTAGMSYLQENGVGHQSLTSKAIVFDENANIKVVDPLSYGLNPNLEYVLCNRYNKCIYLSPEQCESIHTQRPITHKNVYKNDVFTFGLIVIEAALLEKQDKCYLQDCSVFSWPDLDRSLIMVGERYGPELPKIIASMTARSIQTRKDWIGLQRAISDLKNSKREISIESKPTLNKESTTSSQPPKFQQPHIYIPPQQHTQRYYGNNVPLGPLPTIFSVSNEGESSLRQNPSNMNNNISSIPPFSYVSPIAATTNTSNINHFEFAQKPIQIKSALQAYEPTHNGNNHSFLPVYSNFPPNTQSQAVPVNIKFPAASSISPRPFYNAEDMTATFGSGRNLGAIQQISSVEMRRQISPSRLSPNLSPVPIRQLNEERLQPVSKPVPFFEKRQENSTKAINGNQSVTLQEANHYRVVQPNNPFRPEVAEYPPNEPVYIQQKFAKGSRYEGYKLNGMRHGQGKFFYQDGGRYEGEWRENKMNGFGKLFYQSDKIAFEGEWMNDQFNGRGKLYNENPLNMPMGFDYRNFDDIDDYWEFYEGFFTEDLKNGSGKLKFSNGQLFEGTFVDDMVQGEGTFYCRDGQRIRAMWIENHLMKMLN